MVVKKGETGTYVKWLQQGLHITMIIGCSSLFNFIVTNIIYYRFLSVASSPESAQEIFLFPHVSYALYQEGQEAACLPREGMRLQKGYNGRRK